MTYIHKPEYIDNHTKNPIVSLVYFMIISVFNVSSVDKEDNMLILSSPLDIWLIASTMNSLVVSDWASSYKLISDIST